jgi:hypothetical protein
VSCLCALAPSDFSGFALPNWGLPPIGIVVITKINKTGNVKKRCCPLSREVSFAFYGSLHKTDQAAYQYRT